MPTKPHIVHISAYYPPHLGGLERVAQETVEQLARDGYQTTVLTSRIGAKGLVPPPVSNLEVKRLFAFEFAHTPCMPTLLWHLLRVRSPKVFHLHLAQAYVPEMVWLASKIRKVPYIVHFHLDVEPSGALGFIFVLWKKWIQTRVMKDAAHVITLSPDQTTLVRERYALPEERVTCISNGVGAAFLAIGSATRQPHSPLRLLFVGRFSVQKRVDRLLSALAHVTTPVELCLVGDGEDRSTLERMVAERGLQNVTFRGALYGRDLLDAYRDADVFVIASEREGMPLVILEAMAAGLPVIGTNVLGIREVVSGVGILVAEPYAEGFAKAVAALSRSPVEYARLSAQSRDRAEQFSWPALVSRLETLYDVVTL